MSVTIDLREFESAWMDLTAGLRNASHQAVTSATSAAYDDARETVMFRDVTGALRRSIQKGNPGPLDGFIRAGGRAAPYARFVEHGTPPHLIAPRRRQFLRFVQAGQVVFRRLVRHPGTAARPFMEHAAHVGEQTLEYGLELLTERPIVKFNAG